MIYAIMEGHLETVELLHEYGAAFEYNDRMNPNKNAYRNRKNPLEVACYHGKFDIVKYLVENDANRTIGVTYDGDHTPLDHTKNRGYALGIRDSSINLV
jgi:ankyrin repeat protein